MWNNPRIEIGMETEWNHCHKLLQEGDYDNGWPKHEWIRTGDPSLKDGFHQTTDFGKPIWEGRTEPITLLINADFGCGDTIHFFRFCSAAQERVDKVILRCDEDFKGLFPIEIVGKEDPLPVFDKIIHMMALPHALGVSRASISGMQYLSSDSKRLLPEPLRSSKGVKIGVCWTGNPFNPRDYLRSAPVDLFLTLVQDGIELYGLNALWPAPEGIIDLREHMTNWNATAAVVSSLDLVVTVDTAVAHLAGALGKSVCLLINEDPDWRWGLSGDSTIWYDSMKIFRGPWKESLENINHQVAR